MPILNDHKHSFKMIKQTNELNMKSFNFYLSLICVLKLKCYSSFLSNILFIALAFSSYLRYSEQ